MANVNVADFKAVGRVWENEEKIVRVEYDFDNDAGATASELQLFSVAQASVITEFYIKGVTELDSAADGATIDVGITGGTEDHLINGVAEATVAAGAIVQATVVEGAPNVLPMPFLLASGGAIQLKIIGEALTSGKCEFVFKVIKF